MTNYIDYKNYCERNKIKYNEKFEIEFMRCKNNLSVELWNKFRKYYIKGFIKYDLSCWLERVYRLNKRRLGAGLYKFLLLYGKKEAIKRYNSMSNKLSKIKTEYYKENPDANKNRIKKFSKWCKDNKDKLKERSEKIKEFYRANPDKYKDRISKFNNWWKNLDKNSDEYQNRSKKIQNKLKLYYNNTENADKIQKSLEKNYNTKRKNNTFNKSSDEEYIYKKLKEKYKDVKRQYKSNVYPFACDFYIPSLDLYIEYQGSWTHGGRQYIENDKDCIELLEKWKIKSKNSKFYSNAINTWTIRDVNKRNIAKENKLNYIEFFNIEEFNKWIMS